MTLPPIFILSGPRRGSTLLRYILDTHSQIASPGEIKLGMLVRHLEAAVRFTRGEPAHLLPLDERPDWSLAEARALADRIMGAYAAQKGKLTWCEKSIDDVHHLDVLQQVFPEARFICLHRDCLDVVQSCLDCGRNGFMEELAPYAARQPENLVAAMTTAWVEHTAVVLDFEQAHPGSCHRVRYEDLVAAPEECLRPLLAFVGVEWEEGLLAAVFTAHHDQGGGDPKIRFAQRIEASRVGGGQRVNVASIPPAARRAADELSARLGYPPLGAERRPERPSTAGQDAPGGDSDPGGAAAGQDAPGGSGDDGREVSVPAAGAPVPGQARIFVEQVLAARLRERAEPAGSPRGSCRLVLAGPGGGEWRIELTEVPTVTAAGAGAAGAAADCDLSTSVEEFEEILAGRANPIESLWSGKVRVAGDTTLAGHLAQLIVALAR